MGVRTAQLVYRNCWLLKLLRALRSISRCMQIFMCNRQMAPQLVIFN